MASPAAAAGSPRDARTASVGRSSAKKSGQIDRLCVGGDRHRSQAILDPIGVAPGEPVQQQPGVRRVDSHAVVVVGAGPQPRGVRAERLVEAQPVPGEQRVEEDEPPDPLRFERGGALDDRGPIAVPTTRIARPTTPHIRAG